jgi:hypothetical protein
MTEDDAGPFGGEDRLTMLQMLRDALAWQRQVGDTEAAEQTGLYRMIAHEAGITDAMIGGPEGVRYAGRSRPDRPRLADPRAAGERDRGPGGSAAACRR